MCRLQLEVCRILILLLVAHQRCRGDFRRRWNRLLLLAIHLSCQVGKLRATAILQNINHFVTYVRIAKASPVHVIEHLVKGSAGEPRRVALLVLLGLEAAMVARIEAYSLRLLALVPRPD